MIEKNGLKKKFIFFCLSINSEIERKKKGLYKILIFSLHHTIIETQTKFVYVNKPDDKEPEFYNWDI